ncbi:DUF4139 domain-containing protein [uncultured Lacinutrix sp.]|uniref:DUF4139 domain-containing protein n=1 Tax=uncultured Lacinutrix sp. TaxID=574032 RepID=UPI00261A0C01|nr:DUF4139 domain-containing protein [uncultured Lacinutrix sp.]
MNKLFCLLLVFTCLNLNAQTEVSSKIEYVKVFRHNAQITRNTTFTTKTGMQELVLTGISTSINPSSLQIKFNNTDVTLVSAKYENNYLVSKVNNPKIETLKKQLESLGEELSWISDRRTGLIGMETILKKNQDLSASGFTPQQVIELTSVYNTKFLEIRKKLKALAKEELPINEKIEKINQQLIELNAKFNKPSGNIILLVDAKKVEKIKLNCRYIVGNVGWTPLYDLRSSGITENVKLTYKANIYQNTGLDWEDVNIIVSTGNPSQNNNRPILMPLYANVFQPIQYKQEKVAELDEVVVTTNMAYGKSKSYVNPSAVSENQLSIDFNILNKQSITTDGKENLVVLKNYELPTEYVYHTVPKLNKGAFLLAKVKDWSQYNLVSGEANIFFEGAFVGTSNINPQVTAESLLISMGRDNSIVVERTPIKEYTSSKFIGSNKKETIGYDLVVKNKKAVAIDIEVLDQIPVSQNKIIQIVLEEKGTAEYTEDLGKLLWTLNLKPRETKVEKFIYTIKYPKSKSIAGTK